jgi:hypothetical protein
MRAAVLTYRMPAATLRKAGGLAVLVSVAAMVGCGGGGTGGGSGGAGGASGESSIPPMRTVKTDDLPKLGAYLPPLDNGRIEAAPPDGWHVPPRDNRWVAMFEPQPGDPDVTLLITAQDAAELDRATAENVDSLAERIRDKLAGQDRTARLAKTVQPLRVGDFVGVSYQRFGKVDDYVVERWMAATVANGRRYTIELRVTEGIADQYKPAWYAVMAGLKFPSDESAAPESEDLPEPETPAESP